MLKLRLALLLPLALLGCSRAKSTTGTGAIEDTRFAASLEVNLAGSTKTPDGLYYRDLTVGSGAPVTPGQQVAVHYTGWLANGMQFDANGASQTPYSFHLGTGEVIPGWDLGVAGMHVGGKRQLIIPAALGYGAKGTGPIPGNAILVFNVEVVSAQ